MKKHASKLSVVVGVIAMVLGLGPLAGTAGAGLVGHWKLDETSGQTAADSSGNGNDGQLGTTGGADTEDPAVNQAGQFGTAAYQFAGADSDRVDVSAHLSSFSSLTTGTIAFWFKKTTSTRRGLFAFGHDTDSDRMIVEHSGGSLRFLLREGGQNGPDLSTAVSLNQWYHLAVSQDGTTCRLYLDGVEKASATGGGNNGRWFDDMTSDDSLFLGRDWWVGSFDGLLDDVAIWDEVLDTTQISNAMTYGAENYSAGAPADPLSVTVTSPTDTQQFLSGSSVTATVSVVGGEAPYDVTFYTNSAVAWSTNSASTNLFTIDLGVLADGTYTNYATVTDNASSNAVSVTNTFTVAADTNAPTPNPMTFAVEPESLDTNMIVMTASTAIDVLSPPVLYYFENTTNTDNSGWISSMVWTNTGLTEGTTYGYKVKARDSATPSNETAFSSVFTAVPSDPVLPSTNLYRDVGDGTWGDGGGVEWGTAPGGPYTVRAWANANNDSAIFEGTAGTVTLGGSISVSNLTVNMNYDIVQGASQNYVLSFADGGGITAIITGNGTSITAGITNSPTIYIDPSNHNQQFELAPVGASMTLGAISVQSHGPQVNLGGSTTGNSVTTVTGPKISKQGSGEWTLTGAASAYEHYLNGGDLIVSGAGQLKSNSRAFKIYGGTLHYNTPGAVYDDGNNIPGSWNDGKRIAFNGGDLDNTSGSAITASTNPDISLVSDFTFIGSLGANSDLNMGSSIVHLNSDGRQITVSNAASTLTIGGAVVDKGNAYSLTKAGDGTLKLEGVNTYSGHTIVNAGTLSLGDGTDNSNLNDGKELRIATAAGATVELDFVGTDTVFAVLFDGVAAAAGSWGAVGNGAADYTTNALTGTGLLYSDGGVTTDTHFWDGPTTGGTGDGASDGGAGTWSTSNNNWDHGYVTREVWDNGATENAVFGGTAGTVTLGEDITIGDLTINDASSANKYTIQDNTLNFSGGTITVNSSQGGNNNYQATFTCAITSTPAVVLNHGGNNRTTFGPTSGSATLGTISGGGMIELGGSTTGNSITGTASSKIRLAGGTWTITGDAVAYEHYLVDGTLICEGR